MANKSESTKSGKDSACDEIAEHLPYACDHRTDDDVRRIELLDEQAHEHGLQAIDDEREDGPLRITGNQIAQRRAKTADNAAHPWSERIRAEIDHGVGQVEVATDRGRDLHEHGQHRGDRGHNGDQRNGVDLQRLFDIVLDFLSHNRLSLLSLRNPQYHYRYLSF